MHQVNGEFEAVQDALLQITGRLRHHFFRDMFPSINYPPNPAFMDQPPFPPYLGRRELSPPGMFSNYGPPFHGLPPHGGFHPRDDRPPFMHNMHRFGGPRHLPERKPWGPQVDSFYLDNFCHVLALLFKLVTCADLLRKKGRIHA